MATSNYSFNLPTVGGSEDAWGTSLNANWTALDTLLGGVTQTEFALLSGQTSLVPAGVILLWSGSIATIPSGWNLCDGTNGTPDLRNRFVVGAGSTYAPGNTGGADTVTLSEAQIPGHAHGFSATTAGAGNHSHTYSGTTSGHSNDHSHTFSGSTNTTGAHTHNISVYGGEISNGGFPEGTPNSNFVGNSTNTASAGDHSHTFSGTTSGTSANHTHTFSGTTSGIGDHTHSVSGTTTSTGGGTSHENRPPYYALAYIQKA